MEEFIEKEIEATNEETSNSRPMKKKSKVGAVFFSVWVMVFFLLVQVIVTMFYAVPLMAGYVVEMGGDVAAATEKYIAAMTSSDILPILETVATAISAVIALIWYLVGYVRKGSQKASVNLSQKFSNKYSVLFVICAALAVYGLVSLINLGMFAVMPSSKDIYNTMMNISFGDSAISYLTIILLAPINEELIFRGILAKRNRPIFSMIPCIIIQALLFGIMHFNPAQSAFTFILGLAYGYIAYKFESVIPSIICHIINNGSSIVIGMIFGEVLPLWGYAVIMVVFGALTIFVGRKVDFLWKKQDAITE